MSTYNLAGPASVLVNGTAYTTTPTVKYTANNFPQEIEENWSGDNAVKKRWVPNKLAIEFLTTPTFDTTDFDGVTGLEILLLLANGNTVTYANCVVNTIGEISVNDGKCEIEFSTYSPVVAS